MLRDSAHGNTFAPGRGLAVLLFASLAVVLALILAISGSRPVPSFTLEPSMALLLSVAAGALALAAVTAYRGFSRRTRSERSAVAELAELRTNLLTAEAILKAEPQVLVFWEQGQGVRVMMHTLTGIEGLPQSHI